MSNTHYVRIAPDKEAIMIDKLSEDLIRVHRVAGVPFAIIRNDKELYEAMELDADKWAEIVNYYEAELEDPKEVMTAGLEKAAGQLLQLLHSDKAGVIIAAARALVNIYDRMAKLHGLDSPMKIDSTQRQITYRIEGIDVTKMLDSGEHVAIEPSQDS